MTEQEQKHEPSDTIKLLRECDAGIKMGIVALDEVIAHVKSQDFHEKLFGYKQEYTKLKMEIQNLLNKYKDNGKDPDPLAKGMSWMRTNITLGINESDEKVADILTDGCNMGVKVLSKFMNKYTEADEEAIQLANRLLELGNRQVTEIRKFL